MSTILRQQNLKKALLELELSSKEIEVLLALLEQGKASAGHLARILPKISRTSIYDQLHFLEQKGLISSVEEDKKTIYLPEHLGHVIDNLEKNKRALEEKQNALRSVIDIYDQFRAGTAYRPNVRTFKGKEGINAVHREIQDSRKELLAIGDLSAVMRAFPGVRVEDNLQDFQTHKISRKSLLVRNPEGELYLKISLPSEFNHFKWLPKNTSINTDTLIWEGHAAIIDYNEPVNAVVIDNPTIYDTFVSWFEMMWNIGIEIK